MESLFGIEGAGGGVATATSGETEIVNNGFEIWGEVAIQMIHKFEIRNSKILSFVIL